MLVGTVAGVNNGTIDFLREQRDGTGRAVPYDNEIGAHGVEGDGGIDEGFAFSHG